MPLLFIPIAWIAMAAGRAIGQGLGVPGSASTIEKNLVGLVLGLGVLAYGMLAIGLAGVLYPAVAIGLLLLLALAGAKQHLAMAREALGVVGSCFHPPFYIWAAIVLIAIFSGISLVGAFTPPVLGIPNLRFTEWDSISYHLADPKLYLAAHRIYYIPWQHQSNFAFTAEMWYMLGLMFHSIPLAKLFHWFCGLGATLAVYTLAARHISRPVGALSAVIFISTPVVFWEAGVAYSDLAATFFVTVTLLALVNGVRENNERWLGVAAVLMGFTLSTKATAIVTLAFFALGMLYWRMRVRKVSIKQAVTQTALWCLTALIVGAPWYLKSLSYTGNPVYPFYYQIFGGKYWDISNARGYDSSNAAFGLGHRFLDLLLVPWNAIMYVLPGHFPELYPFLKPPNVGRFPFNNEASDFVALSPLFLAALFVPAFLRNKTPGLIRGLSVFTLVSVLFWFFSMQYIRYMLPLVPVLSILTAWVIGQAIRARAIAGYALSLAAVMSLAFSLYVGANLVRAQAPVVFGKQTQDNYIKNGFPGYQAMRYINDDLPAGTKVIFYGQPLGFYCDKPYLWGESGHSTYIPYQSFHNTEDFRQWLIQSKITHILIDTDPKYFSMAPGKDYTGRVYDLTVGAGSESVYQQGPMAIFEVPNAPVRSSDQ